MSRIRASVVMVLTGVLFLPGMALAQPTLAQRCVVDALAPGQAEARLEWMRRCALTKAPPTPITYDGIYYEYLEAGANGNGAGLNMYTGSIYGYEINSTFANSLYLSGANTQVVDELGFYKWVRPANRKKARPLYPVYGNQYDIYSTTNQQLFPHPTLANCSFYRDRNGAQLATGTSFYANGYCEAWDTTNVLTSGVPVSVSGTAGSELYYKLSVPSGAANVMFETSGGSGDMDLHVRYNAKPDPANYDCRPFLGGNNEGCNMRSPSAGTWYVLLKGFTDYTGVSLKGTVFNRLNDGVASAAVSGAQGSELYWALEVPAGMTQLTFNLAGISGNTGDADLYVRNGRSPTLSAFDCRPYIGGNSEVCSFNAPAAGTWYVMVRGWSAYTGVTVTGDYY